MIAVTGLGLVTAAGGRVELARALAGGVSHLAPTGDLEGLPGNLAGVAPEPNLDQLLRRRKDRKLMSRPARLALSAAADALGGWPGEREELGLFVGVGREPPDQGSMERALAVSCHEGSLDVDLLADQGRALYPPLLPLLTLPNLSLSHVAIALGIRGENGTSAGGPEAGLGALREAAWALEEGRAPAALAGATDSQVALGVARDLYRLGALPPRVAPGEGAVFFLLEPAAAARARGADILARISLHEPAPSSRHDLLPARHHPVTGHLGAADALVSVSTAILLGKYDMVIDSRLGPPLTLLSPGEEP